MGMKRGDIVQIGRHRLMCGDAADTGDVMRLLRGAKPHILFTSPPYLRQRTYGTGQTRHPCWTTLMTSALSVFPLADLGQMFVNIGLVHRRGEWSSYWEPWIENMNSAGWRRFGWYVWDTNMSLPGDAHGRFLPRHEFVFHMNKGSKKPHKIANCIHGGRRKIVGNKVSTDAGRGRKQDWDGRDIQKNKPLDSIIKATRSRIRGYNHPAKFPESLPQQFIHSYSNQGDVVCDVFGGSGTTMVATERAERRAVLMEIEPEYCDMTIRRMQDTFGLTAQPA